MSARAELARRVLQMIKEGQSVPTQDVLQLRNWAINPGDAVLSLEAIALLILSQERESDLGHYQHV
jgi:hypothetical protein